MWVSVDFCAHSVYFMDVYLSIKEKQSIFFFILLVCIEISADFTEQLAVQCFLLWTLLPFLRAPIDIRRENLEENGSKLKQLDPAHFAR